jgi:hypothetical protein
MNDQTDHLDQTDEDILSYTVSDEALETAAGTHRGGSIFCWPISGVLLDPQRKYSLLHGFQRGNEYTP